MSEIFAESCGWLGGCGKPLDTPDRAAWPLPCRPPPPPPWRPPRRPCTLFGWAAIGMETKVCNLLRGIHNYLGTLALVIHSYSDNSIKRMQYSSVPNRRACTFINFEKKIPPARSYFGLHVYWFWEKFPPCTSIFSCTAALFWSARLLILRQFSHLHVYFVLHVYLVH